MEAYAACKTGAEVIEVQNEWLASNNKPEPSTVMKGTDSVVKMRRVNHVRLICRDICTSLKLEVPIMTVRVLRNVCFTYFPSGMIPAWTLVAFQFNSP